MAGLTVLAVLIPYARDDSSFVSAGVAIDVPLALAIGALLYGLPLNLLIAIPHRKR